MSGISQKKSASHSIKQSGLGKLLESLKSEIKRKDAAAAKDGPPGPRTVLLTMANRIKKNGKKQESNLGQYDVKIEVSDAEKCIQDCIMKNPEMNPSTFFNLLKSKGIKFVLDMSIPQDAHAQKETDSASSMPQLTREKNVGGNYFSLQFLEANKSPSDKAVGFTKFKVVLLQEGMGNLRDAFYYSKEALKSAISVFEGKKIYADHPTEIEENIRPERSVRDVLGHFENVVYEEATDGRGRLCADVVIPPDEPFLWARSLMGHAVEYSKKYPDKDFIGLSINAQGDAVERPLNEVMKMAPDSCMPKLNEALEKGVKTARVVSVIAGANSVDMVTEAGAGGRVIDMIESNKLKESEMADDNEKKNDEKKDAKPAGEEGGENKDAPAPEKKDEAPQAGEEKEGADQEADVEVDSDKDADADGGDEGHDDAQKDIALIKAMLKKYIGGDKDEEEASEEECQCAKEAKDNYAEMGYSQEEAEKGAAHMIKLARHMNKKEANANRVETPAAKQVESNNNPAETKESKEGTVAEEAKKITELEEKVKNLEAENLKIKGENAKFAESEKKIELAKHLDQVCKESKLPSAVTKTFKESIKDVKSKEEIDSALKLFVEGYKSRKEVASTDWSEIVQPEKVTGTAEGKGPAMFAGITKE